VNEDKCEFSKQELKFLGRLISSEGVAPLPETVQSIQDAESPHNKQSLRSFLGLFNYYRSYVPNAASISSPLYELLKDNVPFLWTDELEQVFVSLKQSLLSCVPLKFFDTNPSVPTYLTTDASGEGIAAVLTQHCEASAMEKPVFYLSRKLSPAEQKFSATEKEFLAVLWAVERLHQFLYGRPFTIRSDHQCLRQLLINGIEGGSAPCRVIRWATRLLHYNYSVEYIPGKKNFVADALSRLPSSKHRESLDLFTVTAHFPDSPMSLSEIRAHSRDDTTLQQIVLMTSENKWPSSKTKLDSHLQVYWNVREHLSVLDDILYKAEKIVIPATLRQKVIAIAHEGHQGMSKCKMRIREYYWWPSLNRDVEDVIRSCSCCHETPRDSPVQVPNYKPLPWHQLALDIKGPLRDEKNHTFYVIVLIDCYTKFVVAKVVPSVPTKTLIQFLSHTFSIFGHCMIMTTDNGPQFISVDFSTFLKNLGIIHRRSAIYNPQANGCVERMNKNFVKLFNSIALPNSGCVQEEVDNYLLNYNATPHSSTGTAPADLMFSFKTKTRLMTKTYSNTEDVTTPVSERLQAMQRSRADYANERRRPHFKPRYKVGDSIITKRGLRRTLIKQVGPFTFKMDDGFTINSRTILRKVPTDSTTSATRQHQPRKVPNVQFQWIQLPCSGTVSSTDSLPSSTSSPVVNIDTTVTSDHNSHSENRPTTDLPTEVKSGRRQRKAPTYLSDYLT